jgi:hypothetical protein
MLLDGLLRWIGAALGAALLGVLGWLVVNFFGQPILDFRKARMKILELADRYAFSSDYSRANEIRKEIYDASSALLVHTRGGSIFVRYYCKAMGYDPEQAALEMREIAGWIGELVPVFADDDTRHYTLSAVYISLGAGYHLTAAQRESYNRRKAFLMEHAE